MHPMAVHDLGLSLEYTNEINTRCVGVTILRRSSIPEPYVQCCENKQIIETNAKGKHQEGTLYLQVLSTAVTGMATT